MGLVLPLKSTWWARRGVAFNEDVRVVKETGLRSVDESRVGSTPTPRIFFTGLNLNGKASKQ